MTDEEIKAQFAAAALTGMILLSVRGASDGELEEYIEHPRKFKEGLGDDAWEMADIMWHRFVERRIIDRRSMP